MSDFTAFHSLVMCGYVCVCDGQKFTGLWNVSWVCVQVRQNKVPTNLLVSFTNHLVMYASEGKLLAL